VHPILARLEGVGWLQSRWEDIDPRTEGRPPRRYYRLTAEGAQAAQGALARAHRPSPARRLRPQAGQA
jgi:DNA-binding PadR family transcriptional regulator